MKALALSENSVTKGSVIVSDAKKVGLDPGVLYSVVVDLSSEGLYTANCINMAAGILLEELGLPQYFFENISEATLASLLESIISSMKVTDGEVLLNGSIAQINFEGDPTRNSQQVWIGTEESRDGMEEILEEMLCGRRREYYYSGKYHTYIVKPERIKDFSVSELGNSRFLFSVDTDFNVMPEVTRKRYEHFLRQVESSILSPIDIYNLPETGETRFVFNSDFASPQLPALRKMFSDHGLTVCRAYWEPYSIQGETPASICAVYIEGELDRKQELRISADLRSFLSYSVDLIQELYLHEKISFNELIFAGNCVDFTHLFIYKETENATDLEIFRNLTSKDQRESFARRVQGSNKSTYGTPIVRQALSKHPDLIKFLYSCFEGRFSPFVNRKITEEELTEKRLEYEKLITRLFFNDSVGYDIMSFMFKIITGTLKTNFYKPEKRSFAFRFDTSVLDPLVYSSFVFGLFYVNGHYACGTHLRAADIARGGLRLIRVSHSNYDEELDNALLLNYALGPQAQRIKHKDICESGSKGVVLPLPQYANRSIDALNDYTEGIMDLVIPDDTVVDYLGQSEMIFFGPDEGTAPLMDEIAYHAREKGYEHWRTLTTGKSFGIPHDTYGLLANGKVFGLFDRAEDGVELQVEGDSVLITKDMIAIEEKIGQKVELSGMTTTSIMTSFRTLIDHYGDNESELNLMITGGPDGDLGANQIQCYRGNICLVIDGGSILFDPEGLNKAELMKIAFSRNSSPRLNSLAFPIEKLSKQGFMVPANGLNVKLSDGSVVEDGAIFHRTFLSDPANRRFIEKANIQAFIPCGGFKDTINNNNVKSFLESFQELKYIVEGANVFFDDSSRRYIAQNTAIKQVKDSTANKGGVFSSSIAEVLTAFLFGEEYEEKLLNDKFTRWALIGDVIKLVKKYSMMETALLLNLHDNDPTIALFELSEISSEQILELQGWLEGNLPNLYADEELTWKILESYIPAILIEKLGKDAVLDALRGEPLVAYCDAILTKKAASSLYYNSGTKWDEIKANVKGDLLGAVRTCFG